MKSLSIPVLIIASVWLSASADAQTCNAYILPNTPSEGFVAYANGTVFDKNTQLLWMRCSVGQKWDPQQQTCRGSATAFTWSQAKSASQGFVLAETANWRLPSVYELSGLTELRCENPAINLALFPNTPAQDFWTATAFVNGDNAFWLVQFLSGENHSDSGKRHAYVRLVREN